MKGIRAKNLSLILLSALPFWASCAGPATTFELPVSPEFVESSQLYKKEYVLGPGDQVEIWVKDDPEASRSCGIRGDGYISLPDLGEIHAAGLTVTDLDSVLVARLSDRLLSPEVKVVPTATRPPMVYVMGQVARPGPLPLRDASTAAQAIAGAGGFTRSSSKGSVSVVRLTEAGKLRTYQIESFSKSQPGPYMAAQSMLLQQDDLIFVPESRRSQFVRFLDDFLNKPLSAAVLLISPYVQYRLIETTLD